MPRCVAGPAPAHARAHAGEGEGEANGATLQVHMEPYKYKARADGVNIINVGKTWEKIVLVSRAGPTAPSARAHTEY